MNSCQLAELMAGLDSDSEKRNDHNEVGCRWQQSAELAPMTDRQLSSKVVVVRADRYFIGDTTILRASTSPAVSQVNVH